MTNRPTPEQIARLMNEGPDGPIVMVNLLKFRAHADYPADKPEAKEKLSGREAYQRYGANVQPILGKIGASLVWSGHQQMVVIGGANEEWDELLCVRYPSRQTFLQMAASKEYNAIAYHRDAALERSALLCTVAAS
jgi:uncharacterized protein (DUF1330 family)